MDIFLDAMKVGDGLNSDLFVDKTLIDELKCVICLDVVNYQNPLQCIKCTNIFCGECINQSMQKSNSTCPKCRNKISKHSLIPPVPIKNILSKLTVKCPLCPFQCPLYDLLDHAGCSHKTIDMGLNHYASILSSLWKSKAQTANYASRVLKTVQDMKHEVEKQSSKGFKTKPDVIAPVVELWKSETTDIRNVAGEILCLIAQQDIESSQAAGAIDIAIFKLKTYGDANAVGILMNFAARSVGAHYILTKQNDVFAGLRLCLQCGSDRAQEYAIGLLNNVLVTVTSELGSAAFMQVSKLVPNLPVHVVKRFNTGGKRVTDWASSLLMNVCFEKPYANEIVAANGITALADTLHSYSTRPNILIELTSLPNWSLEYCVGAVRNLADFKLNEILANDKILPAMIKLVYSGPPDLKNTQEEGNHNHISSAVAASPSSEASSSEDSVSELTEEAIAARQIRLTSHWTRIVEHIFGFLEAIIVEQSVMPLMTSEVVDCLFYALRHCPRQIEPDTVRDDDLRPPTIPNSVDKIFQHWAIEHSEELLEGELLHRVLNLKKDSTMSKFNQNLIKQVLVHFKTAIDVEVKGKASVVGGKRVVVPTVEEIELSTGRKTKRLRSGRF